jgi:hypothetical protein
MRISSLSDALSSELIFLGKPNCTLPFSKGAVSGIGMETRGKLQSIADGLLIIPLHKILACRSTRETLRVGNDEAPQFQDPATAGCTKRRTRLTFNAMST